MTTPSGPSDWTTSASLLAVAGGGCIVGGGLVAAVTDPLDLAQGSWIAAYLVLVGGVAQVAMGWARTWRRADAPSAVWARGQVVAWNVGNACVISGTLAGEPLLVDLGSLLLLVAIAIALHASRPQGAAAWLVPWAYRGLLIVLAVSIPVGIVLSHVRHG